MNHSLDPALAKFIDLIADITSDFTPQIDHPKFRVPPRRIPLDPICDFAEIDPANDPHAISRNIFRLEWDSLPGYSSFWHLYALRLRTGDRAYWIDDANGRRIIAVGAGGVG